MTRSIHITLLTFTPSFGVCFVVRLYPIICLANCPTTLGLREREREKEKKINNSVENNFKAESILNSHVHMCKAHLHAQNPWGFLFKNTNEWKGGEGRGKEERGGAGKGRKIPPTPPPNKL